MPRKTKELLENKIEEKNIKNKAKPTNKSTIKKADKVANSRIKETNKVTDSKVKKASKTINFKTKQTTKKDIATKSVSKNASPKKESSSSKSKSNSKASKSKTTRAKSSTTKKTAKKSLVTSSTTKKAKPTILEYYDLPLSYNQTVVKILYQTPTTLFVYWELSPDDADNYRKAYGNDFFNKTKPVLIVHNDTYNYSFEIDINDFANSWYFNVNDSKSIYRVELGRRPIENNNNLNNNYYYISTSNTIETPNDSILFEKYIPDNIYFKNVKNNKRTALSLRVLLKSTSFANNFMNSLSKMYKIKVEDLYKAIYNNDTTADLYKLINPSSMSSSF